MPSSLTLTKVYSSNSSACSYSYSDSFTARKPTSSFLTSIDKFVLGPIIPSMSLYPSYTYFAFSIGGKVIILGWILFLLILTIGDWLFSPPSKWIPWSIEQLGDSFIIA